VANGHGEKSIFFKKYKQNLSSQFSDLDIENPLGGGALAKFRSSLSTPLNEIPAAIRVILNIFLVILSD